MDGQEIYNAEEIYDELADCYEAAFEGDKDLVIAIHDAMRLCKPHARILDVGCGTGKPTAALLVSLGHDVTGIDISSKMIEIARSQVKASFLKADLLSYEPTGKFDAIFTVLSLFHLSTEATQTTLTKMASWLEDDGLLFLGTLALEDLRNNKVFSQPGYNAADGVAELVHVDPFQMPTRCTYLSKPRWLELVRNAGLDIEFERTRTVTIDWQENGTCDEKHFYVVAKRRRTAS